MESLSDFWGITFYALTYSLESAQHLAPGTFYFNAVISYRSFCKQLVAVRAPKLPAVLDVYELLVGHVNSPATDCHEPGRK